MAEAASGDSWELVRDETGDPVIRVLYMDGRSGLIRVTRDQSPASERDVEFIAHARDDINRLLAHFGSQPVLEAAQLQEVEDRLNHATAAPWSANVESDGGHPGDNMIEVNDPTNAADMYLWRDRQHLAPDADFKFVAAARTDMPEIVAAAIQSS